MLCEKPLVITGISIIRGARWMELVSKSLTSPPQKQYRADIDGLRAVAVLAVVFYHATGWGGGFIGVDVFFVISGFLIVGIIETEVAAGQFKVAHFYERRVRRLFPAFFIVALATTFGCLALLMPTDLAAFGRSLIAATIFLSNFELWSQVGYFDTASEWKPLLHTWSLSVEEQFYLVIPAVMLACHRIFRGGALWMLPVVAAVSLALSIWLTAKLPDAAFYLPFTRAWEIALGGALLLLPRPKIELAWLGIAMIVAALALYNGTMLYPGIAALLPCLGAAAILYSAPSGLAAHFLAARPMVFLGRISYPLYLWHWPLLALARYALGQTVWWQNLLAMALAVLLAALTYHYIERPFRTRRRLASRRAALGAAAGGSALLVAIGFALVWSHGLPNRVPARAVYLDSASTDSPPLTCHHRKATDVIRRHLCVIGAVGTTPTGILWGDSHGWAEQDGYAAALKARGLAAWVATADACAPASGVLKKNDRDYEKGCGHFADAVEQLAIGEHLRFVILAGGWQLYEQPGMRYRQLRDWPATAASLRDTIARLQRAGISVILADPLPGSILPAPRGLAQQIAYGHKMHLEYSTAEFLAHPYFRTAPSLGLARIEAWRAICAQFCTVERNGRPLYFDGGHLAHTQVDFEVPYIEQALDKLPLEPRL